MIVRPNGDLAEIVTQVDHAVLSGQLAAAWAPTIEPRASVLLAARLHDIGWRIWERAPQRSEATGRPLNFLDVDVAHHLVFYQAGIDEVSAIDPYAGLLVAKHAAGIYTGRYGTQPALKLSRAPEQQILVDAFVARQESRLAEEIPRLGIDEGRLWVNYVLLQVFDRLSLWICKGDPAGQGAMSVSLPGEGVLRIVPTGEGASLDPFPFAGPLELDVPVRTVALDGYVTDEQLQSAIASAPVEHRRTLLTAA